MTKLRTHYTLLDLEAIGRKPANESIAGAHPSLGPWKVLLLLGSGIFALIACYQALSTPQPHSEWGIEVTISSLVFLSGFFVAGSLVFRSPYLFTSAYMLALSLFHLGVTIPDALGFMNVEAWHSGSHMKWLEQAGWYTVLALSCMGIGFGLSLTPARLGILYRPVDKTKRGRSLSAAYRDGIGLLLVSCIMFGFAIASFGNLLSYSRVDFFRGVGDTRGLGVFLMVFPSALTLLVIGAQTRFQRIFAWGMLLFGIALIMLSGYRTSALYPMLIGAVVWVKVGRRIPTPYAIVAVMVILVAISAVGILRAYKYQEMDTKKLSESVESANTQDTFRTLGQTGGLLGHVLRLVPQSDPYRYGETYVQYLLTSIPNLSTEKKESARTQVLRDMHKDPTAVTHIAPSDWLTYRLLPQIFELGEGVGFTAIGEPYLNFGLPGVLAFFLTLGYVLGRLDQVNLLERPGLLIFASAILWHLIQTVRDDFSNFLKPMLFTYVFLICWRLMIRSISGTGAVNASQPTLTGTEQQEHA